MKRSQVAYSIYYNNIISYTFQKCFKYKKIKHIEILNKSVYEGVCELIRGFYPPPPPPPPRRPPHTIPPNKFGEVAWRGLREAGYQKYAGYQKLISILKRFSYIYQGMRYKNEQKIINQIQSSIQPINHNGSKYRFSFKYLFSNYILLQSFITNHIN